MIIEKLEKVELDVKHQIEKESGRLKAARSIRELLSQVDFTAEVVPLEDTERLTRLLVSLKGKPLSSDEVELLNEIAKN